MEKPARTQPEAHIQPAARTQPEAHIQPAARTQPEAHIQLAARTHPEARTRPLGIRFRRLCSACLLMLFLRRITPLGHLAAYRMAGHRQRRLRAPDRHESRHLRGDAPMAFRASISYFGSFAGNPGSTCAP